MKRIFFLILLILPFAGIGQNIRIQQMRSTGEPAGRLIVTDGSGSFEFGDGSSIPAVDSHIDNDEDLSPLNELVDSIRIDSVFLKLYEAGNPEPISVDMNPLLSWKSKIDSLVMDGDTLRFYQGGDPNPYNVVVDFSNYWSKSEITEADTTRWGISGTDDQVAAEVPITDAGNYYDGSDVEGALQEIGQDIATAGDNWGSQVVEHDETLLGTGVSGNELKVDTTKVASVTHVAVAINTYAAANIDTDDQTASEVPITDSGENFTSTDVEGALAELAGASGAGSTTLTGEVTGSGTGTVATTIANDVIDYGNVAGSLKSGGTNNTLSWDISANGVIDCSTSGGSVTFSNLQTNKVLKVKLTTSGAITWPANATVVVGSAEISSGTYYVICDCWGSEVLVTIVTGS